MLSQLAQTSTNPLEFLNTFPRKSISPAQFNCCTKKYFCRLALIIGCTNTKLFSHSHFIFIIMLGLNTNITLLKVCVHFRLLVTLIFPITFGRMLNRIYTSIMLSPSSPKPRSKNHPNSSHIHTSK